MTRMAIHLLARKENLNVLCLDQVCNLLLFETGNFANIILKMQEYALLCDLLWSKQFQF